MTQELKDLLKKMSDELVERLAEEFTEGVIDKLSDNGADVIDADAGTMAAVFTEALCDQIRENQENFEGQFQYAQETLE